MQISILTESDNTDLKVHQNLIRKILTSKKVTFKLLNSVTFHGKSDLIKNLPLAIKILKDKYKELDYITVIVDSDNISINQQKKEISDILKSRVNFYPLNKIIVGVACRNIEAWLLSDEISLNKILNFKIKGLYRQSEKIIKPKIKMRELYGKYCSKCNELSKKPKMYPDFLADISENINIETLKKRSSSFKSFMEGVLSTCL